MDKCWDRGINRVAERQTYGHACTHSRCIITNCTGYAIIVVVMMLFSLEQNVSYDGATIVHETDLSTTGSI